MSDPQSSSTNWFGSLQLAYKYIVVFCGLLVLVFLAGLVKVFFDRRKLKKNVKTEQLEAGPKEDQMELNQREKDEGDLFGIRAIEAGFYAGVAQSRPTSRAGSVIGHPAMSSSTLVGGSVNSPLMKGTSANASVLSLNLGPNDSRRTSPPNMKLRPSEAELTGKHGAVDMSLQVPPSPGIPRGQTSPTFGSDDGSSDGFVTPRSNSPRASDLLPQHYNPTSTIAMPDALQVTYHDGADSHARSQVASFNTSPAQSPTPPHPGNPPATRLPTLPTTALRKESRSPSPESKYPQVRVDRPTSITTTATSHKRDESDGASSTYSQSRLSTFDAYQAYQKQAAKTDARLSVAPPQSDAARLSVAPNGQEQRLSEFYDAYYRNSMLPGSGDAKRGAAPGRQSTIVEVDTPLASPMYAKKMQLPGAAF